jgi:hypothetical protein
MLKKTFIIPDFVIVKNKSYKLNLNVYRNLHYQILNNMKVQFKKDFYNLYPEIKTIKAGRVEIEYNIQPYNKALFDTMNIVCIVDKFFLDALSEAGVIPDDNYNYVSYSAIKTLPVKPLKSTKKEIVINCTFFQ